MDLISDEKRNEKRHGNNIRIQIGAGIGVGRGNGMEVGIATRIHIAEEI